jgi:hypothetical protein
VANAAQLKSRGIDMEVKSYCDSLTVELTGWKAKIYDIVRAIDKMPSGDKGKMLSQVNDLHALVEELDERIDRLKRECPTEWSPDKIELDSKLNQITNIWQEVWQDVSGADVGG